MTDEATLVVIETSGIQDYIFGSNRLRENIGASYLVEQVTSTWLEQYGIQKLAEPTLDRTQLPQKQLLWSGGGNARILFATQTLAQNFIQKWSKKLLEEAPGVRATVVTQTWQAGTSLAETHRCAMEQMRQNKQAQLAPTTSLGLGVNAVCQSTGLPAVGLSRDFDPKAPTLYPVSHSTGKKLGSLDAANNKLKHTFKIDDPRLVFPFDFDNLGRSEHEQSYIAVVHIDGNGMGQRFQDIANTNQNNDTGYIHETRQLSELVEKASNNAIKACLEQLQRTIHQAVCHLDDNTMFDLAQSIYLPFRPIVYGGDDVTFVCDGRIGLVLAMTFLKAFHQYHPSLYACAGVAIVKAHYPFARAYRLAEELCSSAKKMLNGKEGSVLDWHIAPTGITGDLETIRQREYSVKSGSLTTRPLMLEGTPDHSWRTWQTIESVIKNFRTNEWQGKTNKIMHLREAVRGGPHKVTKFVGLYGELPDSAASKNGWIDHHCLYFDPIELLDFYYPLEVKK